MQLAVERRIRDNFGMPAATHTDLYRSGNAGSAQLSRLRLNIANSDVETYRIGAEVWVRAGTGGVSTFDRPQAWRGPTWRLPAGTDLPDELVLRSDISGHWTVEPARDMRLSEYEAALETLNARFVRL